MVSTEPFSHGIGTLRCLQKERATYRHWSVSLWRDPYDVPHWRILSPDKTEWWVISATLCRWNAVSWLTSSGSWHAYEKKNSNSQWNLNKLSLASGDANSILQLGHSSTRKGSSNVNRHFILVFWMHVNYEIHWCCSSYGEWCVVNRW